MKQLASLFAASVLVLTTAHAATGLNVKTGLWEVTYTTKMEGSIIPKSALEQMPPERRAKVEASMKQRASAPPRAHTLKSCVTDKDLQKGAFDADPDGGCKKTLVSQSATHQEVKFVCTDDGETRTGHMTVDAKSNDRMQGAIEIVTPNGKVNTQLSGKWIGVSCAAADKE
ncbi:MAG: DUF3617 family protein [Pseudomonadota bacterium]